jgi:RNase P/RNase MRP subunit POP5
MPSDPSQVPSVACLLYLAADQVVPRGMSGTMLKATKVPCRPVWVQPIGLSATIAAATFLSLRDTGSLTLGLQEVTN